MGLAVQGEGTILSSFLEIIWGNHGAEGQHYAGRDVSEKLLEDVSPQGAKYRGTRRSGQKTGAEVYRRRLIELLLARGGVS